MEDTNVQAKGRYKVVVVDDERKVLIVARKIIASAGYDVEICEGVTEASEIIANQGPVAVVISDNRMPEMRGTEFLENVRKLSPNTVRILTTAFYDKQLIEDIVNKAEAFRFLKKPIDFKQALRILDQSVAQYERNVANENYEKNIQTVTAENQDLQNQNENLGTQVENLKSRTRLILGGVLIVAAFAVGLNFFMDYLRQRDMVVTSVKQGDWIVYENGTALDQKSGLMWMVNDFRNIEKRNPKNWNEAMEWADRANRRIEAGYDDWRVPTIREYQESFDPDRTKLAFDKNKDYPVGYPKVFQDGGGYGYWSNEQVGENTARYFFFIGGYEKTVNLGYNSPTMSVRLVRTAQ